MAECYQLLIRGFNNIFLIMIIIGKLASRYFSQVNTLARYLQPFEFKVKQLSTIPTLKLKSEKQLLQNWWSQKPFDIAPTQEMNVPIFSFLTGQYLNKQINLPQDIFNYPLRRDLMFRLYDYRIKLNKFTTKVTRTRGTTHGSNHKMRQQKGMGMARMGHKRAPHLFKGGKAHGAKAVVYSYPLNAKIKINALKALLSGKMSEGKIKIVDTQEIQQAKTKYVGMSFKKHIEDDRGILCIITGQNCDEKFIRAQQNHQRVLWHDTYSLDVMSLFKADKILITQEGLQQLIQNIYKTIYVVYRHPYMPKLDSKNENQQKQQVKFDPSQPYEFKFKILAEYMQLYDKIKEQKPLLLKGQKARVRKVELL